MTKEPYIVLLADDDDHDVIATKRAWRKNNIINPLRIVRDGEECLDYLHQRGKYSDPESAPAPGILLLDLKMPKIDGLTVLKRIRENEKLHRLPVIILTTSQLDEDRLASYDLGANAYIRKPVGFENLSKAVQVINVFWELVELPE